MTMPTTTCHYCHRTITEVYGVPMELEANILSMVFVGRECLKKAKAEGWDLPERIALDGRTAD